MKTVNVYFVGFDDAKRTKILQAKRLGSCEEEALELENGIMV